MAKNWCFFLLVTALAAAGPPLAIAERILLPVVVGGDPIPGAYGSLWKTELTITNIGETTFRIDGLENQCRTPGCPPPELVPYATVFGIPIGPGEDVPGTFISVAEDRVRDLHATLRAQDISRQGLTWGTRIPVVPESRAFTGRLALSDLPMDDRFRVLIRVYDFSPAPEHSLRIRFYSLDPDRTYPEHSWTGPDALLTERVVSLTMPRRAPHDAGYAQITLQDIPELAGVERVRAELEGPGTFAFWAFASITNNETQHITVIAP